MVVGRGFRCEREKERELVGGLGSVCACDIFFVFFASPLSYSLYEMEIYFARLDMDDSKCRELLTKTSWWFGNNVKSNRGAEDGGVLRDPSYHHCGHIVCACV